MVAGESFPVAGEAEISWATGPMQDTVKDL